MAERPNKPMNKQFTKAGPGLTERIRQKFRHGLVMLSIQKALSRYGIHFVPHYWVLEGQKELSPPEIRDPGKNYKLRNLYPEDIDSMQTITGITQEDIEILKRRLAQGKIECIALFQGSHLAAQMFMEYGVIKFNNHHYNLGSNEAYLNDMYTFHEFRGKNLAPHLRYQAYQLLRKKGIDKFYSISDYWNQSTHRFKHKLGAKKLELRLRIGVSKLFDWNIRLRNFNE